MNNSSNLDYFKKSSSNLVDRKVINTIQENDAENDEEQNLKSGVSKVVRFDASMQDTEYTCKIEETIIESFTPIPYADDDENDQKTLNNTKTSGKSLCNQQNTAGANSKLENLNSNVVEAINEVLINRETVKRGRLDKSFSTPTYDTGKFYLSVYTHY